MRSKEYEQISEGEFLNLIDATIASLCAQRDVTEQTIDGLLRIRESIYEAYGRGYGIRFYVNPNTGEFDTEQYEKKMGFV